MALFNELKKEYASTYGSRSIRLANTEFTKNFNSGQYEAAIESVRKMMRSIMSAELANKAYRGIRLLADKIDKPQVVELYLDFIDAYADTTSYSNTVASLLISAEGLEAAESYFARKYPEPRTASDQEKLAAIETLFVSSLKSRVEKRAAAAAR
ncbi:MAG: hypothetical protein OEL76_14365 [Siculibacillus sp.]|nr:hypothetical protein [Siculibacillus sp.]